MSTKKPTRPALTTIMNKGQEAISSAPEGSTTPFAIAIPAPRAPQKTGVRAPGLRSKGWVQLNVLVPEDLRHQAKLKALTDRRDLSEVISELLAGWVKPNA